MSTYIPSPPCTAAADVEIPLRTSVASRLADYLELTKPRISALVLVTVSVGFTLGSSGSFQMAALAHALLGIALVAAGSSAINQYLERGTDARMMRTASRPLPAGRLLSMEVLAFGLVAGIAGAVYLALAVNVLTAVLAALTYVLYTAVYTPLKRKTSLCTAIGAIPGALPPVLGWTAAGGSLDLRAMALFAILFVWQFPHFLAIAWLYRQQYAEAGLRMLPAVFPRRGVAGFMSAVYAVALVPVSLLPRQLALAGDVYLAIALLLGFGYAVCAVRFMRNETTRSARVLLWSSLIYLPVLLMTLTWDYLQLLR